MKIQAIWAKCKPCEIHIDASRTRYDLKIYTGDEMARNIHARDKERTDQAIIRIAQDGDLLAAPEKGYSVGKVSEMRMKENYEVSYKLNVGSMRSPETKVTPGGIEFVFKSPSKLLDIKI